MNPSKSIKLILLISTLIIVIISSFYVYILTFREEPLIQNEEPIFICGTKSDELSEFAANGKLIFNTYCAACHKINRDFNGPALADVKYRAKMDLYKFITNEKEVLKTKNKYALKINKEWKENFTYNHKFDLTKEEITAILSYCSYYY